MDDGTVTATDAGTKTMFLSAPSANFATGVGDLYASALGADASVKTWLGTVDSNWSRPENWDAGAAPGAGDGALIVSTAASDCPS